MRCGGLGEPSFPSISWPNTPEVPLEARGTSGMKAALNGVPHFSVLNGSFFNTQRMMQQYVVKAYFL
jgi:glucan phosphorylase